MKKYIFLLLLIFTILPCRSQGDYYDTYVFGKRLYYSPNIDKTDVIPYRVKGDSILVKAKFPFLSIDTLKYYRWDIIINKKLSQRIKSTLQDTTDYEGRLDVLCLSYIDDNGGVSNDKLKINKSLKDVAPHGFVDSWGWKDDIAGYAKPYFEFTNVSDKTIKYITFYVQFFNAVEDPIKSPISKSSILSYRCIGPVKEGETKYWTMEDNYDEPYYIKNADTGKITKILIDYMDGSKYTLIKELKFRDKPKIGVF